MSIEASKELTEEERLAWIRRMSLTKNLKRRKEERYHVPGVPLEATEFIYPETEMKNYG